MLETLDLSLRLSAVRAGRSLERLGPEIAWLQHAAYEHGLPVIIICEGWTGAGKGDGIGRLVAHMDPRGFRMHATRASTPEELLRPELWRFWLRLPARGAIAIFDQSWHHSLIEGRAENRLPPAAWERALAGVQAFERQLTSDGVTLIKFWLHVSPRELKRRLRAWEHDPYQKWRLRQAAAFDTPENHRRLLPVVEEVLARTHAPHAPWVLIEAEDDRYRRVRLMQETARALRRALAARGVRAPSAVRRGADAVAVAARRPQRDPLPSRGTAPPRNSPLSRVDLSVRLERPDYKRRLESAQGRLRELEFAAYVHRQGAVVVFEGWDAAGKGGAIKRLTERLDPRGYDVIPIAAPTQEAAARHYLWRFWREIPKAGHLAIFDRSWYGRVLVERVEGLAPRAVWGRAYQEINEFERALWDAGLLIVKFWLQISPDEQLRRFRARETTPGKQHKITPDDWRNRSKLPLYQHAISDMLRQTSTGAAPWTIVEAEDKLFARVKVIETVIAALERALAAEGNKGRAAAIR